MDMPVRDSTMPGRTGLKCLGLSDSHGRSRAVSDRARRLRKTSSCHAWGVLSGGRAIWSGRDAATNCTAMTPARANGLMRRNAAARS